MSNENQSRKDIQGQKQRHTKNSKARRIKFLDIACASLGIVNPSDSRRGDVAQAYIDFGEEQCLAWLLKARGDISKWEELAGTKQARKPVQAETKARRNRFLIEFCEAFGIHDRRDVRRSQAAQAFTMYGENRCREWLEQARGQYSRWEASLAEGKRVRKAARRSATLKARRKAAEEAKKNSREEVLAKSRYRDTGTPTVIRRDDPRTELAKVRQQLQDELSKGRGARKYILASLRERISELSAEADTPTI